MTQVVVVRNRIRSLSERGVFRGWMEEQGRGGRTGFRFRWLLDAEFHLLMDPNRHLLEARDILPGVPYPGFMDRDLRAFLRGRGDPALPEHRRLDEEQVNLRYRNRRQQVTLELQLLAGDFEYGVTAMLGLINDLFSHLQMNHVSYLQDQFGLAEE